MPSGGSYSPDIEDISSAGPSTPALVKFLILHACNFWRMVYQRTVNKLFCIEGFCFCFHFQDSICNSRGIPGWEAVDNLAGYLVSLNRMITGLSTNEIAEILRLYSYLHAIDQSPSKYSLKCKKKILSGPWRASRKRNGSAPGQQAAERWVKMYCTSVKFESVSFNSFQRLKIL